MHLIRLYHTLKDLRWQQYWYRLWYPLKRKVLTEAVIPESAISAALSWPATSLKTLPVFDQYNPKERSFTLLNIQHKFPDAIDWNLKQHGMLWLYHLNYFAWLGDESLSVEDRLQTLKEYSQSNLVENKKYLKAGLDSYPISLRGMSIVRFCLNHGIKQDWLARQLFIHYNRLFHFPEYQLQANHLWQNGCSLLCAGYYFKEKRFYEKGKRILNAALEEQVLSDGGHIEGSPMYHSLLLSSLLQCIELAEKLEVNTDPDFPKTMRLKAEVMLGWLEQVTFNNGIWPQVNDSTSQVAPSLKEIQAFANNLNIYSKKVVLSESGYRMLRKEHYELFVDIGTIQPAWQPGHSHSDELSFCLNIGNEQVIIDPGIDTYETGKARSWQRSTDAHNTLSVKGKNASDVWKSFRVGKKTRVIINEEKENFISASHRGYSFLLTRIFTLSHDSIVLEDIAKHYKGDDLYLNYHFAPHIILKKYRDFEFLAGNLLISIEGNVVATIETYYLSVEFNKQVTAQRLHIKTGNHTITRLRLLNAD